MKDNGGPAFPVVAGCGADAGMTLRDYFAAKAMQGFCANVNSYPTRLEHYQNIADDAYTTADAMLKARKSEPLA